MRKTTKHNKRGARCGGAEERMGGEGEVMYVKYLYCKVWGERKEALLTSSSLCVSFSAGRPVIKRQTEIAAGRFECLSGLFYVG